MTADAGHEAGVPPELACCAMVGVACIRPMEDDRPWLQLTDDRGHGVTRFDRVYESRIRQSGSAAYCDTQDACSRFRFLGTRTTVAERSALTRSKIQNADGMSLVHSFSESAATQQLGVVGMGHDGEEVYCHGKDNKA